MARKNSCLKLGFNLPFTNSTFVPKDAGVEFLTAKSVTGGTLVHPKQKLQRITTCDWLKLKKQGAHQQVIQ